MFWKSLCGSEFKWVKFENGVKGGEFEEKLNCDPVVNSDPGNSPGLEMHSSTNESFLGLQNGDSRYWNGNHGWSYLTIYTPGSTFQ